MTKDVIIYKHEGGLIKKSDHEAAEIVQSGLPAVVMVVGKKAPLRFIEFFTAEIRNPNTRRAYHRAVCDFFGWCEKRGLELERIGPVHVAAYIEGRQKDLARPSVKQHLAAIRMVFDYLVLGQVIPTNPRQPCEVQSTARGEEKSGALR
jgi:site-specific recombinase XerD